MKPHPRIRKAIKWGGAAVTVLLVVVWIGSGWGAIGYIANSGKFVAAAFGRLTLGDTNKSPSSIMVGFLGAGPFRYQLSWLPQSQTLSGAWQWWIPLWMPILPCLLLTALAWRLDALARRRAGLNLCPKCHYDREGLRAGAVCPECGAAAV